MRGVELPGRHPSQTPIMSQPTQRSNYSMPIASRQFKRRSGRVPFGPDPKLGAMVRDRIG